MVPTIGYNNILNVTPFERDNDNPEKKNFFATYYVCIYSVILNNCCLNVWMLIKVIKVH